MIAPIPQETADPTSLIALKYKSGRISAMLEVLATQAEEGATRVHVRGSTSALTLLARTHIDALETRIADLHLVLRAKEESRAAAIAAASTSALRPPRVPVTTPVSRYGHVLFDMATGLENALALTRESLAALPELDTDPPAQDTVLSHMAKYQALAEGLTVLGSVTWVQGSVELARIRALAFPDLDSGVSGGGVEPEDDLASSLQSPGADPSHPDHSRVQAPSISVLSQPIETLEAYTGPLEDSESDDGGGSSTRTGPRGVFGRALADVLSGLPSRSLSVTGKKTRVFGGAESSEEEYDDQDDEDAPFVIPETTPFASLIAPPQRPPPSSVRGVDGYRFEPKRIMPELKDVLQGRQLQRDQRSRERRT